MARESFAAIARRRMYGVCFIGVIVALVALSIAFYNKTFTKVILVTLRADHTGNQLVSDSDVKERGIIVGTVRDVKVQSHGECQDPTGTCALVTLALDPGRAAIIPNNVSAQILPKTMFGEQYVALQLPAQAGPHIKNNDVIPQDRSQGALETEKVLGDILPLLQAVKPAELNATLSAIATALQGRGEELGQTLVTMDRYLTQLNPDVPQLVDDLKKLGQVAVQFNNAAPDVIATLNNMQTSARTLLAKKVALDNLLTTATNTSNIISSFLADNEERLITLSGTTDKVYTLLNQYSPEFGCLLAGLSDFNIRTSDAIRAGQIQLSAQMYVPPAKLGKYVPGDQPKIITGLGPHCFGMPNPMVPFKIPPSFRCINDGAALTTDACSQSKTSAFDQQAIGSPAETALVNTLIAGTYGTTPDAVPAIATILTAPAMRGTQVDVK
jgi:phospholipid/cholesterol/gamma-HCH transport system substrate-binding protein